MSNEARGIIVQTKGLQVDNLSKLATLSVGRNVQLAQYRCRVCELKELVDRQRTDGADVEAKDNVKDSVRLADESYDAFAMDIGDTHWSTGPGLVFVCEERESKDFRRVVAIKKRLVEQNYRAVIVNGQRG